MDYQKEYLVKNPELHASDAESKARAILNLASGIVQPDSILDIACGSGLVLQQVVKELTPERAVGLDISESIIAEARKLNIDTRIVFQVADAFSYSKSHFNLVLAIDIVEHVNDDLALLKHISSLGEYVIIKVPIEHNFLNSFLYLISGKRIDYWRTTEAKYGHIHHYGLSEFISKLRELDLHLIKVDYMPLPKRSAALREILRWLFLPLWFISRNFYVRLTGGFLVVLLKTGSRGIITK